jgi:predicted O-linked N-acetylglucosamine transferase (SPINDLY family)
MAGSNHANIELSEHEIDISVSNIPNIIDTLNISDSIRPTRKPPALRASKIPVAELYAEAVRHHQAGRLKEAEKLYRRICKRQPSHAESWSNLGLVMTVNGDAAEAVIACRKAIELRPAHIDAYLNLIAALQLSKAFDEAADIYRQVIPLAPARADLWHNFGVILTLQGRLKQSVLAFREAIALKPDSADAYFNMARTLSTLGWNEEAINSYRHVLALNADHAAACSNLGTMLGAAGHFTEATAWSLRAASLAPENAEIFCNLGVVLHRQGKVNEAVAAYEKALSIKPDYASALGNIASGFQEQYKFDEAAIALKRAIAVNPDFDTAIVELIKIRRHICDWSEYQADHDKLIDFIIQKKDVIFMLLLMGFSSNAAQQHDCARQSMKHHNEITQRVGPHSDKMASEKIRIGYLSTDFRDHPVGRLLPDFLARHDRDKVEVIGYSLGVEDAGALRQRIRHACDSFVDLHQLSNLDAARRIHADQVDILVDLTGPTVGSRQEILALRPAPVQVSFLGWPATMGADFIDYIIADAFIVPRDQQEFYSEKIVHLPNCYQPSDSQRPVPENIPSRAECGLPEEGFVFCSFNNPNKITPDMFDLWMRLLLRVEKSVLWLYCKSKQTIENLTRFAESRGVSADRLIFASVVQYGPYLGRLQAADLFLDTTPYNAGATCNDALWVGLPILTCSGETYISRMAGSLLSAAGLPELVTYTLADYEELAVRLATEPGLLESYKERLVRNRESAPLFDMRKFTVNLERAYSAIQNIRLAGESPRFISIDPAS